MVKRHRTDITVSARIPKNWRASILGLVEDGRYRSMNEFFVEAIQHKLLVEALDE